MILHALALLLLAGSCLAQDSTAVRMDETVATYVASGNFMGSVLVARDNHVLLNKGYGYASLEWQVPDSPTTVYRLASLSKQFTAASILLLQERGKLDIHDPIRKYLPDAPPAWDKITIYHLLTHTSGIPNYSTFADQQMLNPFPITPMQLVARFWNRPLDFVPGEKWFYTNSGYALLGYLIERITGQSYGEFVQQNIFQPLGMAHSRFGSDTAIMPQFATGYALSPQGPLQTPSPSFTMSYAAGAICSTTEDLLRWEQALFFGTFLSPASVQAMTKPFKNGYALGLATGTEGGHKLIAHNGTISGFSTQMAYYPDSKTIVIVLSNLGGAPAPEIASKLAAIAMENKPGEPQP